MFVVSSVLLLYSLLTFGAVQAGSWLLVAVLWLTATAVCLTIQTARSRHVDISLIVLLSTVLLVFATVPAKLAIELIALVWAWTAARTSNSSQVVRFMHFLLAIGVLEALLGLFQFFISPGWILGYLNPFHRSSGTFMNRNHFAGLLEMVIPTAFGLAYIALHRYSGLARTYLYLLAAGFLGTALVFSVSRMGIFSFFATVLFIGITLQLRHSRRGIAAAFAMGVIGVVIASSLWIGTDVIVQRYSELAGQEALLREGRLLVFRDAAKMIREHPFGVGIGNFQDIYRQYQTFRLDLLFDHAHNDYLEVAAEWGMPIAIVFWSLILFAVVRSVRLFITIDSPTERGILLACSGSVFSILLHSLTDFNLQIPSNAMLFFTFVGISLAMSNDRSGTTDGQKN